MADWVIAYVLLVAIPISAALAIGYTLFLMKWLNKSEKNQQYYIDRYNKIL